MSKSDSLILEIADFTHDVLTGIYSEETGEPQPLVFDIAVRMTPQRAYTPDTPLTDSKNYMDLIAAASSALPKDVHFKLIESVADHICTSLMAEDDRIEAVTVKIVKPKISAADEKIGMTLHRERR